MFKEGKFIDVILKKILRYWGSVFVIISLSFVEVE